MKKIVLTTFNARYTHTSIALRYLYANIEEYQNDTVILEFSINEDIQSTAEKILEYQPYIIGIGVYIWNALDVHNLIEVIKKVSPLTKIVLGGPEVSHRPFRVNFDQADFIIQGEGEHSFYKLCKDILTDNLPNGKIIKAPMANLDNVKLPYAYYTDHDVAHRYIYVEASRGCPFSCEFCLSSIDKRVRNFKLEALLEEFEILWQRGVRSFKFIDRTFNLNINVANRLLDFFLSKEPPYFVHFEVIPDHFPESLKDRIAEFPAASLQLEIGIQTLNPKIASNINRKLDIEKIKLNLQFLESKTNAHMHLDLIVGLPGESLESFGKNLNDLCSITHSEIQIGILKKLSGTTLSRHDIEHGMTYSIKPPYDLLQNDHLSFFQMQKMKRFARFWDMIYNSGNFSKTVSLIFKNSEVFENFFALSQWIYNKTDSTWKISLDRLAKLIFDYLTDVYKLEPVFVADMIVEDIMKISGRKVPKFLREHISSVPKTRKKELLQYNKRQIRHTSK